MKNLIYFVCLAFAGIFLLGCEKNDMPEPENQERKNLPIPRISSIPKSPILL